MLNNRLFPNKFLTASIATLWCLFFTGSVLSAPLNPLIEAYFPLKLLGKYGFFDKISSPPRMACVTCHDPATGGTGSVSGVNLHQVAITGANPHTVGNLKPPTNMYASFIDEFHPCNTGGLGPLQNYCGGNFWNSRSEGRADDDFAFGDPGLLFNGATRHIGEEVFYDNGGNLLLNVTQYAQYFGPTADQALNPMPNPVEQNIARKAVCEHVKSQKYAALYQQAWGVPIDCSDDEVIVQAADVRALNLPSEKAYDISFKRYILAICAWQHSKELNSFSSKRDKVLQRELDGFDVDGSPGKFPLVGFTDEENYGHDLFYATRFSPIPVGKRGAGKFANCAFCHADDPVVPGPGIKSDGTAPLERYAASDFHNIGTPPNPEIPDTGVDPDEGIFGHVGAPYPKGFFKTPTVRNVNKRKGNGFIKAYTHNGFFKSIESIVHFYNTALVYSPGCTDTNPPIGQCDNDSAATPSPTSTAALFGITRCPDNIKTEKQALANNCWPAPAYATPSAVPFLVGNFNLNAEDEAAIVAYLKTLTDNDTVKAPSPYKP